MEEEKRQTTAKRLTQHKERERELSEVTRLAG